MSKCTTCGGSGVLMGHNDTGPCPMCNLPLPLDATRNHDQRLLDALHLTARHASQISVTFMRGMASRMAMSYEKYGDLRDAYPGKIDAIASLKLRLDKYALTGNTEYLMDAANFAMIEFMRPRHPDARFEPTDSDGSPGRVHTSDIVSQEANTVGRENMRRGGSNMRTDGGFYQREGD